MLNRVLHEIENAQGTMTVRELSRKLAIEANALEGMLQFWVRKGRIQDDDAVASHEDNCGATCSGLAECAFVAKMPRSFSLPTED